MSQRFIERTVLITGASRGIGAATAIAFAREGARVAVNFRSDEEGAHTTCRTIRNAGGVAEPFQADVADADAVVALSTAVENALGPVDVLVNNAAAIDRSAFLDVSPATFDEVWHSNVSGVFRLSQLVARGMVARRRGAIVNVSSILASLAVPNRTAYIASKGAIEALTRAMALDLSNYGVRVNAVAPGLVATTALFAGFPNAAVQADVERYIPGGRFGRPDELAAAILFLASDDASYLNGAVVPVDAGLAGREAGPPMKPLTAS
jgi:NAD(P)-dependent dehydrogenase (short-subunit alcohol dehydrogenase family)